MANHPLNVEGGTAAKVVTRLDDPLRQKVLDIAEARGVSVSVVIREALAEYARRVNAELDALARDLGDGGDG